MILRQDSEGRRWVRHLPLAFLAASVASADAADGPPEPEPSSAVQVAEALSASFRHAVEVARPSVVTLRTVERRPESDEAPEAYRTGNATGVIVDAAGGVLTNNHAVADAEVVFVVLADGREFPASEILGDARSDLALVRIRDAGQLPAARLGDSETVDVGDWVIAAGDSFGLGFSANPGTVSAKQRELAEKEVLLLQTNAPSNPGNSGGPLLNLRGEVVGICEGGYSVQGGFDGVSFAIPVATAKFVARELAEHGTVRWPYLGVHFESLSPDVARALGCPAGQDGAVVTRVVPGTPAAEASFHVGDIITRFAADPIRDASGLTAAIQKSRAGDLVEVVSFRGGVATERQIRLGVLPQAEKQAEKEPAPVEDPPAERYHDPAIGLTLTDLPAGEAAGRDLPPGLRGVFIDGVESRSAARYLGMHPGTVITHVGPAPVRNLGEFKAAMRNRREGEGAVLLVWCDECGEHFFSVRPKLARLPDRSFTRAEDEEE